YCVIFFSHVVVFIQHLLSFPTRRSSDLIPQPKLSICRRSRHELAVRRKGDTSRAPRNWEPAEFRAGGNLPEDNRSANPAGRGKRSEEHTSELQSLAYLVCRLLLEKKKLG